MKVLQDFNEETIINKLPPSTRCPDRAISAPRCVLIILTTKLSFVFHFQIIFKELNDTFLTYVKLSEMNQLELLNGFTQLNEKKS